MISLKFFLFYSYVFIFKVYFYYLNFYLSLGFDIFDMPLYFVYYVFPYFSVDYNDKKTQEDIYYMFQIFDTLSSFELDYLLKKLNRILKDLSILEPSARKKLEDLFLIEDFFLSISKIEDGLFIIDGVNSIYTMLSKEIDLHKLLGVSDSFSIELSQQLKSIKLIITNVPNIDFKFIKMIGTQLERKQIYINERNSFIISEVNYYDDDTVSDVLVNFIGGNIFCLLFIYFLFLYISIKVWDNIYSNYNFYSLFSNLVKLNLNVSFKNNLLLPKHLKEFKFEKNSLYDLFFNIKSSSSKILRFAELDSFYSDYHKYDDETFLNYFFENKIFIYKRISLYLIVILLVYFLYFYIDFDLLTNLIYNLIHYQNIFDNVLNLFNFNKIKLELLILNIRFVFSVLKSKLLFLFYLLK